MNHNWWLATLEHLGLLTRDEAQHLSQELKTKIHKDTYVESFREVETVLSKGDLLDKLGKFGELQQRVKALEAELTPAAPTKKVK